jgi:hypothetical protein
MSIGCLSNGWEVTIKRDFNLDGWLYSVVGILLTGLFWWGIFSMFSPLLRESSPPAIAQLIQCGVLVLVLGWWTRGIVLASARLLWGKEHIRMSASQVLWESDYKLSREVRTFPMQSISELRIAAQRDRGGLRMRVVSFCAAGKHYRFRTFLSEEQAEALIAGPFREFVSTDRT